MKIFALSVVKNEVDVIESNLKAASKWADKIFIWDNGSTDGTWEKILELQDDIITPWKQDGMPFNDTKRHMIYNEFKHYGSPGDWWCFKFDADEFYADDPREFLKNVPSRYHYVCARFIQFQLTEEDVAEFEYTGDFAKDKDKIPYFGKSAWVEARFVRHRDRLTWPAESGFPKNMGIVYPRLITTLHYQYRSPQQVQKRLDQRHASKAAGYLAEHVKAHDWREVLMKREELYSVNDHIDMSTVPAEINYLHKPHKLLIKRILHGLGILP